MMNDTMLKRYNNSNVNVARAETVSLILCSYSDSQVQQVRSESVVVTHFLLPAQIPSVNDMQK